MVIARQTGRRCVASRRFRRRRIRHGVDLQGGVICRWCNAKAVNLRGGELRCGEIGAVIVSAEIAEAVKCGAPTAFSTSMLLVVLKFDQSSVKYTLQSTENYSLWLSDSSRVHQIRFRPELRLGHHWGAYNVRQTL